MLSRVVVVTHKTLQPSGVTQARHFHACVFNNFTLTATFVKANAAEKYGECEVLYYHVNLPWVTSIGTKNGIDEQDVYYFKTKSKQKL